MDTAIYFRDQLRQARAIALNDAEAFDEIIFVIERIGAYLSGEIKALHDYYDPHIRELVSHSPMVEEIPSECRDFHIEVSELYGLVKDARNDALHIGAFARHLTTHAIELSLILEEALLEEVVMNNQNTQFQIKHFMVKNPVCAYLWQPLGFIRQTMLAYSFSYLPVQVKESGKSEWKLISDHSLAVYLRKAQNKTERKTRLMIKLEDAIKLNHPDRIILKEPSICKPNCEISKVLGNSNEIPVLVKAEGSDDLLGILTSFDLL